jgi:predicted nucleic acid-binding protein
VIVGARTAILDSDVLIEIMDRGLETKLTLLFSKIYVPIAVKQEQVKHRRRRRLARMFKSGLFHRCSALDQISVQLLSHGKLGHGESEAIIQAQEKNIEVLLTNDRKAQKTAARFNLRVLSCEGLVESFQVLGVIEGR